MICKWEHLSNTLLQTCACLHTVSAMHLCLSSKLREESTRVSAITYLYHYIALIQQYLIYEKRFSIIFVLVKLFFLSAVFFTTRQQLSNYSLLKIYTSQKSFVSICFRLFKSWYIVVYSGVDKPTESIILFSCWCAFSESTSFLIYSRAMRGTSFRSAALRSQSFIMQIRGLPR